MFKKTIKIFLILACFAILAYAGFRLLLNNKKGTSGIQNDHQIKKENLAEAINGKKVLKELAEMRPMAVMVENHPDARPQSGLSQADIVYETLAEGGITRFLTIFQSIDAREIGPVRSAREYFAQIADEWGALYAHVGGSNEAVSQIKSGKYKNLSDANEYYNFELFPRRKDKPEPHHIFTSTEKLRELIAYHKFSDRADFQPWKFKDDRPATTSIISKISIDFSRVGYEVGWEYNAALNTYGRLSRHLRYGTPTEASEQYFKPHIDDISKQQLSAKNVVVQIVKVTPVPKDPLLQVDIDLAAGGRAIIFQDGQAIEASWRKEDGRTRFYDAANQEIKFNRGPIWLELVPSDKQDKLKYE